MIEVLSPRPDLLGECPVWDARSSHLYSIDIDGRSIHRQHVATGAVESLSLTGRPGCIALTDDPDILIAAVECELMWVTWSDRTTERWRELPTGGPRNRLNDGALDRNGRLWIGSMHEDATESSGLLQRVDRDGTGTRVRDGVGVANGIAFSPDGTRMYFADTIARTVWAHAYDPATGALGPEWVFSEFQDLPGSPDGATVDVEGCYWIACVFGSAIARITPHGEVDRIIELPVDKPTKPAFGGDDLDILFVTSIGGGASHPRYDEPGLNGCVLAVDVGVRGLPEPVMHRLADST